jgi:hypothetical protein
MPDDQEKQRAREEFRKNVQAAFKRADESFRGVYAEAIGDLLALSQADIRAISPDPTCVETYDKLIQAVKEASRLNVAQAELKRQIVGLGQVAVSIAGRIPSLASLL